MFKRLRNIRPGTLAANVLVTLAYPLFKGLTAERNGLLVFTDALTIIALALIVGGIVYALILRGDFDVSGFAVARGFQRSGFGKGFRAYMEDRKEEREAAFNYPLFLGLVYLAAAIVLAYGVL